MTDDLTDFYRENEYEVRADPQPARLGDVFRPEGQPENPLADVFSGWERSTEVHVREEAKEAEQQMEVEVHDDRTRENSHTSLSRMRLEWSAEDRQIVDDLHDVVDNQMLVLFGDAYRIMNDLYDAVREPVVDADGVIQKDENGWTVWSRDPVTGGYIEDYSLLTGKLQRHLLFQITTRLFEWEQTAVDRWGDSMFAKAAWEAQIAQGFEASKTAGNRTVEDRTQYARRVSREERYFAIFQTLVSRKAEALVRSMERLGQRLKDVLSV